MSGRAAAAAGPVIGDFVVASTPQTHLVYTNHIYLADDPANAKFLTRRSTQTDTFVLVNDRMVFVARAHKGVAVGDVALSSVQRDACGVALGQPQPCRVQVWDQPRDGSADLVTLKLEVELVGNKRSTVAAAELAPFLIKMFAGQVFTKGQVFASDFNGTALKFHVEYGEAGVPVHEQNKRLTTKGDRKTDDSGSDDDDEHDDGAITKQVDRGVLQAQTTIDITAAPSKFMTFKPADEKKPSILNPKFKFSAMGIGGLDAEFGTIFRRAFASRLFPVETVKKLGIKHVKGMLLYGPPGTGKTLIARQIGKMLATKEPKVVNGPEILNKYVGAAEEAIRNLFKEADDDQAANGDNSELHIIILDEIDAIAKARGRGGESGAHMDTIVNQLLTKIDGVNSLNNILVIGMTNRKDMLDPALLRAGRLEVHIEIGLPNEKGRVQILNIHTKSMKDNGMLGDDVDIQTLAERTKNFSGGEIETLIKSAASFALYSSIDIKKTGAKPVDVAGKKIIVTMDHFEHALSEVKPMFGVDEDELKTYLRTDLIDYGSEYAKLMRTCTTLIEQVRSSKQTPLLSILLEGVAGTGKTSLAAKLAIDSGFPYVKVITPEQFVGYGESKKINDITTVFENAYKSPLSLIILDNIERLIEYVAVGPRFSPAVLQTLLVLINRIPPSSGRKLMIIGTTSKAELLESLELTQAFNIDVNVRSLESPKQIEAVLRSIGLVCAGGERGLVKISNECFLPIPIRKLLMVAEMARQATDSSAPREGANGGVTSERFQECLEACGFSSGALLQEASLTSKYSATAQGSTSVARTAARTKRVVDDESEEDM